MSIHNETELNKDKSIFVLNIIKFSIPTWVGFFINIFSVIIITRFFLPDAYGLINTFNATSTLFLALIVLGLDSGFIRYFFEPPSGYDRKRLFLICILISVIVLILISLFVIAFLSTEVSELIFGQDNFFLLILLSGNVISLLAIRFITIYYRMEGNTLLYSIVSISMQLALKGALVFAALVKPEFMFALSSSVASMIIMVILFYLFVGRKLLPSRKTYSITEIQSLKHFFNYSIYTWPIPILLYTNTLVTLIIIRDNLGLDAVGLFASVGIFVGLIGVLQGGFTTFWSGFMFENYKTQKNRIRKMHDFMSFFLLILMTCFILFRDLMYLLLGSKYQDTKPFFALLILSPLLLIYSETTSYGISIAKKTKVLMIVTFISILSNIVIIWILIPVMGLLGACLGSAFSGILFFILQSIYGQKYYRSIEHYSKTAFTIFWLVLLAFVNLFLNYSFLWLTGISLTSILISGMIFRNEIFQLRFFMKSFISL